MVNTKLNIAQKQIQPEELNDVIIDAIQEVKGKDIKKYDLHQLDDASADYYIICHGISSTQISGIVGMIARNVSDQLGIKPNHSEGTKSWMLIDYFSVIVHVFSEEKRGFYSLDDLWSDAEITAYEDI